MQPKGPYFRNHLRKAKDHLKGPCSTVSVNGKIGEIMSHQLDVLIVAQLQGKRGAMQSIGACRPRIDFSMQRFVAGSATRQKVKTLFRHRVPNADVVHQPLESDRGACRPNDFNNISYP